MLGTIRKRGWYPLMSLLLVAVLVPVQAAGCCRLAAVLGFLQMPEIRPAGDPPSHACCRREAAAEPAGSPAAAEPGKAGGNCGADSRAGSDGCCLEGAPHADPGLVSTESVPAFPVSARLQVSDEPLPASPSLPALDLPADPGPPVYLACRRLLI